MKLRIKYCGGCNPLINRTQVAKEAIDILRKNVDVEIVENEADVGIIVAGCEVACVDQSEIEDQAKQWVIVGGNLVDHRAYPTHELPAIIAQKIMEKYSG